MNQKILKHAWRLINFHHIKIAILVPTSIDSSINDTCDLFIANIN